MSQSTKSILAATTFLTVPALAFAQSPVVAVGTACVNAAGQMVACVGASPPLDLTPIIIAAIGGVFSIIGIVATALINSHMKDKQAAAVLSTAVKNSLGAIQQAGTNYVTALSPKVNIPGVSPQLQTGIQYVLNNAGPEMERLGVTPEGVASKIDAQIGIASIASNIATAASPAPTPAPLDPVVTPPVQP